MEKRLIRLFLILLIFSLSGKSQTLSKNISVYAAMEIFEPNADLSGGIIATMGGSHSSSHVTLRLSAYIDGSDITLYELTSNESSSSYTGFSHQYQTSQLGGLQPYFLGTQWSSDNIKQSFIALSLKLTKGDHPNDLKSLIRNITNVKLTVTPQNASWTSVKVPGLGIIEPDGSEGLFDPNHFCWDIQNEQYVVCQTWRRIKSPQINKLSDLEIVVHRGWWGNNLGSGYPENTKEAIAAAAQWSNIVEADFMRTGDNDVVALHDYLLNRITDLTIHDPIKYTFETPLAELKQYRVRKRNGDLSNYHVAGFDDILPVLVEHDLVLLLDIKEDRPWVVNGNCEANCTYNHNPAKQKESLINSLKRIIALAKRYQVPANKGGGNAMRYLGFKSNYSYSDLAATIPLSDLSQMMVFPIIFSNRFQNDAAKVADYMQANIQAGKKGIMGFETNFKLEDDVMLKSFNYQGVNYDNIFKFIYDNYKLRGGIFAQEPAGPAGNVSRWGQYIMTDTSEDFRGDPFSLANLIFQYSTYMLITTDRADVWKLVQDMQEEN